MQRLIGIFHYSHSTSKLLLQCIKFNTSDLKQKIFCSRSATANSDRVSTSHANTCYKMQWAEILIYFKLLLKLEIKPCAILWKTTVLKNHKKRRLFRLAELYAVILLFLLSSLVSLLIIRPEDLPFLVLTSPVRQPNPHSISHTKNFGLLLLSHSSDRFLYWMRKVFGNVPKSLWKQWWINNFLTIFSTFETFSLILRFKLVFEFIAFSLTPSGSNRIVDIVAYIGSPKLCNSVYH